MQRSSLNVLARDERDRTSTGDAIKYILKEEHMHSEPESNNCKMNKSSELHDQENIGAMEREVYNCLKTLKKLGKGGHVVQELNSSSTQKIRNEVNEKVESSVNIERNPGKLDEDLKTDCIRSS